MANHFLVGQIVRIREDSIQTSKKDYFHRIVGICDSVHILTEKDIKRGYYYTKGGSLDLSQCEVVSGGKRCTHRAPFR